MHLQSLDDDVHVTVRCRFATHAGDVHVCLPGRHIDAILQSQLYMHCEFMLAGADLEQACERSWSVNRTTQTSNNRGNACGRMHQRHCCAKQATALACRLLLLGYNNLSAPLEDSTGRSISAPSTAACAEPLWGEQAAMERSHMVA